ncbi:MAG: DegT/DnrJ/EryC1/StrS family aminotransferase [Thermodesulfobacteriota bacterium]|nr:DegT/DnrJ/EryC1/StrS family aminotransferase [Thermodesulfobacteriota bacterium]
MIIQHSKPTLDDKDCDAVSAVLRSGHLSLGEYVRMFEAELSQRIGVKGAVATNSGTSALHLALLSFDIGEGDEVIIPSYVCSALLNAIHYVRATPILADIVPDSFNLDAEHVKQSITERTKAIIVPHLFGLPADLDELLSLGVPLIEDCAQALGASYHGKHVGSFGVVSIFSFYATKVITSGEGGMILSHSEDLLEKARDLRDYDNKDDYKIRFNYKMTDLQGALGMSQIEKLPFFLNKRKSIAERYTSELGDIPALLPREYPDREHIFYRYVIRVLGNVEAISAEMKRRNISCERPVYNPVHSYLNISHFPQSDRIWKSALSLPIYPSLSFDEVARVINEVKSVLTESQEI